MEGEHCELQHGEMFLTNIVEEEYHKISYKTKRMGNVAYAVSGYVVKGIFPVFVQKDEYDKYMKGIERRKHDDRLRYRCH